MSSFILRLEEQQISNLYISLSFLLIWNFNDKYIHTRFQTKMVQKTCPLGWHMAFIREYHSWPQTQETQIPLSPRPLPPHAPNLENPGPENSDHPHSQIWKTQTPHSPKLENSDLPISISPLNSVIHHLNNWPAPALLAIKAMVHLSWFDALFIF